MEKQHHNRRVGPDTHARRVLGRIRTSEDLDAIQAADEDIRVL